MQDLHAKGDPVTPFNVILDPSTLSIVNEAGGITRYLGSAVANSLSLVHPVEEAKLLVRMSQKREFIIACQRSALMAASPSDDQTADEHAAHLNTDIERIIRGYGIPDFQNDFEISQGILADMKDQRQPFSTGLGKLDTLMGGGLYPGRSYGFAARKKVGKTVLASTISCNLNLEGVKHLFICGEMSPKEIHQRNLARLTNSFPSEFRNEYSQNKSFETKVASAAFASKRCILYHNAPGLTFTELKRVASSAVFRHSIKGFILDYWQLVGGKEKGKSTSEHLDEVAQWIADFGRKHGVWTITFAQINQEGNTRGGEGIRMAFDQVYQIRGMGENEDISFPDRWLEMMDTRYTAWGNIGSAIQAGLSMNPKGPYFELA
jgi:replicative DNA helicase